MKVDLINLNKEKISEIDLEQEIFGLAPRKDIVHRVIEWQLAKRRAGTHKTKTIGDISGTTKKPYKQKGTGNARQGSLRSPQFRGGAVIFGPVVRSHELKLNKKIRKLGLRHAFSDKLQDAKLFIVDKAEISSNKTKELKIIAEKFSNKSVLFIVSDAQNENFKLASQNLFNVNVLPQIGSNVYDIIKNDVLVIEQAALINLQERLK